MSDEIAFIYELNQKSSESSEDFSKEHEKEEHVNRMIDMGLYTWRDMPKHAFSKMLSRTLTPLLESISKTLYGTYISLIETQGSEMKFKVPENAELITALTLDAEYLHEHTVIKTSEGYEPNPWTFIYDEVMSREEFMNKVTSGGDFIEEIHSSNKPVLVVFVVIPCDFFEVEDET